MKIGGVIVAAGRATRMGEPKALLHLGGKRILDSLIEAFVAAKLEPIALVASGPTLGLASSLGVIDVEGDPEQPMIDSIARGLEAIRKERVDLEGAIVQPVDAPFTTSEMIAALRAGDPQAIRVLCHQGRPGHPVLLPRRLFDAVSALPRPQEGLRTLLAEHDVELVEWLDDRVLADIDTPEDLARWRSVAGGALN